RDRYRPRLGSRPGLHREGLAREGHRRHGGSAPDLRAGGARGRFRDERRRPQGPQGRRVHGRLGNQLDRQRGVAPPRLRARRDRAGADRRRHQPHRGAEDEVRRCGHREPRRRPQRGSARRGPHPAALRRSREGLPHPRDLRHRQGDRREAGRAARISGGLVRHHRVHVPQQGRDRRHREGRDGNGRADHGRHLRRADADVFRRRPVQPQGACDARPLVRRDEDAGERAGHEQTVHGSVPAQELTGGLKMKTMRKSLLLGVLLAVSALAAAPSGAAEKLRVGKAVPEAFSFVPLDIGMRQGIFARHGLDIESIAFAGDARMQQAMASDSLDVALGSGPAMAFIAKGAPIKAVAAMAGPPLLLAIVVRPDGPKTVADLKGKTVSVSTAGSLTYWLVSETSRRQGWGPNGITIAPMGAMPGQIAALKRGDIQGAIMDIGNAFDLEKRGEGRILVRFTDIKDFHIHIVFATNKLIAEKPDAVRQFLAGWFETIAFMRENKAESVKIAMEVTNKDEDVTSRSYDELMPMFSDTGKFDPAALETLRKSYIELKLLPTEPDMSQLYTESFLPKS